MKLSSVDVHGMGIVTVREFTSNLRSVRMLILAVIFSLLVLFIAYVGSLFVAFAGPEVGGETIEHGPSVILYFLSQFIGFIGPIIGLSVSFDLIVREKVQNSLSLLLSRPVSRRSVAVGKFLGATAALAVPVLIVNVVAVVGIVAVSGKGIGALPVAGFLLGTLLFLATYCAFGLLISSVSRTTTTAILAGIGLWFSFWLFLPIASYFLGSSLDLLNPATSYGTVTADLFGASTGGLALPVWGYYVLMVLWVVLPLLAAVELFQRKEV
jgi:ABC-type transport system involved in multi-copper enzyme maturation permease subunit